mmetsp:Transcript_6700/g.23695  ORF Transcript_6700/g.23695 Transcript_6700/m.23695 type:complete len:91 (-) Transcript_6700:203-475(-)
MGNRYPVEEAITAKMGPGVKVTHACGLPFTVVSVVDGNKGERECLPGYFNCPYCVSESMCAGAIDKTAERAAKALPGPAGAPAEQVMSAA